MTRFAANRTTPMPSRPKAATAANPNDRGLVASRDVSVALTAPTLHADHRS